MNINLRLGAAALLGALGSFWAGTACAQPRMPTHVACVGDSITAGTGASSTATNYPSDLQGLFGSGVQVKNFGRSSATMLSAGNVPYVKQTEYTNATTFVSGAGANAVVDVIIMLGTNDSKPVNWNTSSGTRSQDFATDAAALIDHFAQLSTHPAVYLALPLYAGTNTYTISGTVIKNEIIPLLKQVAMQKGIATIDLQTPTTGHPEYLTDGVHPNDAGYRVVSQTMHDGLLRVPQVSITMPATGAVIAGSLVNITADASGGNVAISSVEFVRGSTSIATSMTAPFSAMFSNAAPGAYTLTAKATDATGALATSTPVQITVGAGGSAGGAAGASAMGGAGASAAGAGAAGAGASGAGGVAGTSGIDSTGTGGAAVAGAGNALGGTPGLGGAGGGSAVTSGSGSPNSGSAGASDVPSDSSGCSCRSSRGTGTPRGSMALVLILTAFTVRRVRRRAVGCAVRP